MKRLLAVIARSVSDEAIHWQSWLGSGIFAEPVIGPRIRGPVWLAMMGDNSCETL